MPYSLSSCHSPPSPLSLLMSDPSVSKQQVYLLFAREVGPMVKAKYPNIQKIQFNQILGRIWTEMPEQERNKYEAKADYLAQLQASGQKEEVEVVEQKPVTPKKKLGRPKKKKEMTPGKVYSMDLPNSDIGRIFIQRVDGPESSPAAGGIQAPARSSGRRCAGGSCAYS